VRGQKERWPQSRPYGKTAGADWLGYGRHFQEGCPRRRTQCGSGPRDAEGPEAVGGWYHKRSNGDGKSEAKGLKQLGLRDRATTRRTS